MSRIARRLSAALLALALGALVLLAAPAASGASANLAATTDGSSCGYCWTTT